MTTKKSIPIKDKLTQSKLIKIVPFDNTKHSTKAHKHNGYLELVYLFSTIGTHEIDGKRGEIQNPCLLVIRKNDVHQWTLTTPVVGFVILLKNEFIANSLDLEIAKLIEKIAKIDHLKLHNITTLKSILEILTTEQNPIVIEGLFKSLLAKTIESNSPTESKQNVNLSLYDSFMDLLLDEPKIINSVAHYANILHTTPQNLNASCKKYTDLSASEIIANQIIKEAKRLIYYTQKSMSEIAHELGFSDKSNFSKYFKKRTGHTPKAFKQTIN
ncbi:AraC family transcriptional regulator [Sphingobacterium cavernae]|uniref:AraC family transcriptional regulator n=1 Tax=Sphingobacterium cavernae TaxID=2592657 RepID=UPI00122FEC77|nr:helix-turn-helix transcriptional regulator [Sphingobacterium cavernae]